MSISIVITQMAAIFVMMGFGYLVGYKKKVTSASTAGISFIVANIANPALMLSGALNKTGTIPFREMLIMAEFSIILDVCLIMIGIFMGRILHAKKEEWGFYNLMTLFGNTGMIGIPVVSAVMGSDALVYMGIFNIIYMLMMYTYGIYILERQDKRGTKIDLAKCLLNPGSIISFVSVILFTVDFTVPIVCREIANYIGNSTCFLSILVIGITMANGSFGKVFINVRLYIFAILRFLVIPVVGALVLSRTGVNEMMIYVCVLILSMPVANMPAILAEERGMDNSLLSEGIILTTLLSLLFIPAVTFILNASM